MCWSSFELVSDALICKDKWKVASSSAASPLYILRSGLFIKAG